MIIDETKYGYVYEITNLINNKTYIGKHRIKQNEKWETYLGSGHLIFLAIRKYGRDSFTKKLLLYAMSDEELSDKEIKEIQKAKQQNKAEYNILTGDATPKDWVKYGFIDDTILDLYFNEKMSTRDIAYQTKTSQALIVNYLAKFKETDERFLEIRPGKGPKKIIQSAETRRKASDTFKNLESKKCPLCGKGKHPANFKKHYDSCKNFPVCEVCSKKLSKKTSKRCSEHKIYDTLEEARGYVTNESRVKGGMIASHNRWHIAKNIINITTVISFPNGVSALFLPRSELDHHKSSAETPIKIIAIPISFQICFI